MSLNCLSQKWGPVHSVPSCTDSFARTASDRGSPACSFYEHGLYANREMAWSTVEDDRLPVSTANSFTLRREIMQVIQFKQFGDPAQLELAERPRPKADGENAIVRVDAASVTRAM